MSRKIDALIAQHVFGYIVSEGREIHEGMCYRNSIDGIVLGEDSVTPVPYYSTNISDAWEVEKVFSEDCKYVSRYYCGPDGIEWCFDLVIPEDGQITSYLGESSTAPMAICLAALKAKGVVYE